MGIEFNPAKIKLVIGLGNPDKKYENTYHNAGRQFVDFLLKNRQNSQFSIYNLQLLKANSFMNESGGFVKKALQKNGVEAEELVLAHDDSDLALGKYKISFGRGAAGHKGVESVIKALKTRNFWRLRIGIRSEDSKFEIRNSKLRPKAGEFVLNKISATNKKTLKAAFEEISRLFTADSRNPR